MVSGGVDEEHRETLEVGYYGKDETDLWSTRRAAVGPAQQERVDMIIESSDQVPRATLLKRYLETASDTSQRRDSGARRNR